MAYASFMYYSAVSGLKNILSNVQMMPLQIFHDLNSNKVHYYGN